MWLFVRVPAPPRAHSAPAARVLDRLRIARLIGMAATPQLLSF